MHIQQCLVLFPEENDHENDEEENELWAHDGDSDDAVLRIKNVRGVDSGVYSCVAKTTLDHTEDSTIIAVQGLYFLL